jgi:hypothetical protein
LSNNATVFVIVVVSNKLSWQLRSGARNQFSDRDNCTTLTEHHRAVPLSTLFFNAPLAWSFASQFSILQISRKGGTLVTFVVWIIATQTPRIQFDHSQALLNNTLFKISNRCHNNSDNASAIPRT